MKRCEPYGWSKQNYWGRDQGSLGSAHAVETATGKANDGSAIGCYRKGVMFDNVTRRGPIQRDYPSDYETLGEIKFETTRVSREHP
jgi:hypothetical protein